MSNKLSIIVPVYNEEESVERVIADILLSFPKSQIIIVNDGSTDSSINILEKFKNKITIITHLSNLGYGASIKTGIENSNRDYLSWFDSDGQHNIKDLEKMLDIIFSKKITAVVGNRLNHYSKFKFLGKFAIKIFTSIFGYKLERDINCGLRIIQTSFIKKYIEILPDGFSASLTSTLLLMSTNSKFDYMDINIDQRIGKSKVKIIDGAITLAQVFKLSIILSPMKIFFPLGIILIILGIIYGTLTAFIKGLGYPPLSLIVINFGLIISLFALVISHINYFFNMRNRK